MASNFLSAFSSFFGRNPYHMNNMDARNYIKYHLSQAIFHMLEDNQLMLQSNIFAYSDPKKT